MNFLTMKDNFSIKNLEIYLYFIIWTGSSCYGIYSAAKSANDFFTDNYVDVFNDFTKGWPILNRLKDVSDMEWKTSVTMYISSIPWYLIHIIVTEYLRYINKQLLIYWYAAISLFFISVTYNLKIVIYFLFQPVLGYLLIQFKSKTIIWCSYIISLIIINYFKYLHYKLFGSSYFTESTVTVGIFWCNLRCINYCLEAVKDENYRKINFKNIVTSVAYSLYFPLLISGPVILFTDFKTVWQDNKIKNLSQRIKELTLNLMRFIFWFIFIEFLKHYVYINALAFHPKIMNRLSSWALYGGGYSMGQYFHLKYVVYYGISSSLANFEGIPIPTLPKCIGRIHLYSDMWKYFDRGLYLFIVRYMYIPTIGEKKTVLRKIFSSTITFTFIFVWHGLAPFVAIWSFLNFVGILTETLAYELSKKNFVEKITNNMSEEMYRRVKCFLAAPLFALSAISNFYFFAGQEVGNIYMHRFFTASPFLMMNTLIVMYCGCQVSTEIKLWESRKVKKVS